MLWPSFFYVPLAYSTKTKDMKRFLTTLAIIVSAACAASAQPRSAGIRIGATGLDATYQHKIRKDQFIEGNIGMDFGYSGKAGFKATAIYNFVWARPAWTERGSWALYAGPGLSIGGVNDLCVYKFGKERIGYTDSGFMFAFAAQVGLEYNFDFPLQLALDVRPYFGVHVNDGVHHDVLEDIQTDYGSTAGFYDNGLLGFVPTISVRYRF